MIYVLTENFCHDSYHSSERYGEWHEHHSCSVQGVCLNKPDRSQHGYYTEWDAIELGDREVSVGDTVYVITMTYDTGDSFGYATGKMEVMWATPDRAEALDIARAISQQQDEFSVKFTLDSGKEIRLSNPGAGYFESVTSIDVDAFAVTEDSDTLSFRLPG